MVADTAGAHDGLLINDVGWTAGIDQSGLLFDGVDDRVDCGGVYSLNMGLKDFTISTWVNMGTSQTAYPTFVAKGAGAAYDPGYWFHFSQSRLKFYLSDRTSRINAYSNILSLPKNG